MKFHIYHVYSSYQNKSLTSNIIGQSVPTPTNKPDKINTVVSHSMDDAIETVLNDLPSNYKVYSVTVVHHDVKMGNNVHEKLDEEMAAFTKEQLEQETTRGDDDVRFHSPFPSATE